MNITSIGMKENVEFTLAEAEAMLPLVNRIVDDMQRKVNKLLRDEKFYIKTGAPESALKRCHDAIAEAYRIAGVKLWKLSIKVLGDGYVGFSNGVFYWSWRYGEDKISYYHPYDADPRIFRRKLEILTPTLVIE